MAYNQRSNTRSFGGRHSTQTRRPVSRSKNQKQYINPAMFIRAAKVIEAETYQPVNQFVDFEINQHIKDNIVKKGYLTPSKIQDISIPHGLMGKDVIGIANTGTGKTAAFAIPLLHSIMQNGKSKALIMAPTRELASQIEEECRSFAKGSGLFGALLIGGSSMGKQIHDLRDSPSIVIGTPGRIKDHINRGTLKLASFDIVVLDEVDRMVDMGFITDIRFILSHVSAKRQSLFFSATIDQKIEKLIQDFMTNPVLVSVKTGETSDNVEQNVIRYSDRTDKLEKLHDVLVAEGLSKALVFDETKFGAERLAKELVSRGFKADALHGGKSQSQRERALSKFRTNHINILVATDVAARGIDVTDISHVINYALPNNYQDYVHRIGRAGRASRRGHALTFINS